MEGAKVAFLSHVDTGRQDDPYTGTSTSLYLIRRKIPDGMPRNNANKEGGHCISVTGFSFH
jgi:hypothetical protein